MTKMEQSRETHEHNENLHKPTEDQVHKESYQASSSSEIIPPGFCNKIPMKIKLITTLIKKM